jgi:hypothetical protein
MITLASTGDYALLFVVAAVSGMIGGLAAELLLNRDGDTGTFEVPMRKGAFLDLGGFAPLLIGAVVGVAILIVFPPETTFVTNAADGTTTSSRAYDMVRLVTTSLVAGSAGGSVLSALQARVAAAVSESRIQSTIAASEQQLEQLRETATAEASERIRAVVGALSVPEATGARPRGALGDAPPPGAGLSAEATAEAAIESFTATMGRQTDRARATVEAAAEAPRRR